MRHRRRVNRFRTAVDPAGLRPGSRMGDGVDQREVVDQVWMRMAFDLGVLITLFHDVENGCLSLASDGPNRIVPDFRLITLNREINRG